MSQRMFSGHYPFPGSNVDVTPFHRKKGHTNPAGACKKFHPAPVDNNTMSRARMYATWSPASMYFSCRRGNLSAVVWKLLLSSSFYPDKGGISR